MSGFRLKCSCRALGQLLLFVALAGLIQAEEKRRMLPNWRRWPLLKSTQPEDRGRWAYQPPKRPEVPKVREHCLGEDSRRCLRSCPPGEGSGVMPAKPADRAILLRRVTFDLTGLPPSPEEIDAFVKDPESECLRQRCRAPARQPALWRTLGATLAGCSPLCRHRRF